MLKEGDPAPDFALLSDENETITLQQWRGTRLVLFFYPRAGTSGCTRQACGFRDNFPRIDAAGATVVGVSPDMPEALATWKAAENLPFTLLSDPDHAVADAYGAWGEKSMYGRKFMGIIRSHFIIGPDGRLEDVRVKISPQKSVEAAMHAVQAAS